MTKGPCVAPKPCTTPFCDVIILQIKTVWTAGEYLHIALVPVSRWLLLQHPIPSELIPCAMGIWAVDMHICAICCSASPNWPIDTPTPINIPPLLITTTHCSQESAPPATNNHRAVESQARPTIRTWKTNIKDCSP